MSFEYTSTNPSSDPSKRSKGSLKSLTSNMLGASGVLAARRLLEASGRRAVLRDTRPKEDFSLSQDERKNLKEMILDEGEFLLEYPAVEPELLGERRVTNRDFFKRDFLLLIRK